MATAKVLGNYELLQQILLHLPLRSLLLAQNINKAFYDVVQRSQEIKQALFLTPGIDPARASKQADGANGGIAIFNPFLDICNIARYRQVRSAELGQYLSGNEDAIFIAYGPEKRYSQLRGQDWWRHPNQVRGHALVCRRPHKTQPLGSRGDMLLAHPPQTTLAVKDWDRTRMLELATGVTFGALVDLASTSSSGNYRSSHVARTDLPETSGWLQFSGTVDAITGFEMLSMLETGVGELIKEGLVFKDQGQKIGRGLRGPTRDKRAVREEAARATQRAEASRI